MKYEERRSPEYLNRIVNLLIEDRDWLQQQRRSEIENRHHQDLQLLARKVLANAKFEHSKENIDKLLLLNKRLHELQDECAKITFDMYKDLMELKAKGKSYYETFCIETYIVYESEEDWERHIGGLVESYDRANRYEVSISDAPGKEPTNYKELNKHENSIRKR